MRIEQDKYDELMIDLALLKSHGAATTTPATKQDSTNGEKSV